MIRMMLFSQLNIVSSSLVGSYTIIFGELKNAFTCI